MANNNSTIIHFIKKHYITILIVALPFFIGIPLGGYLLYKKKKNNIKTWSDENDKQIKLLHPEFREPISKLINDVEKELGIKLKILSGLRSFLKQSELYEQLHPQGKPVAPSGYSYHNYGLAVDFYKKDFNTGRVLTVDDFRKIEKIGQKYGIKSGISFNDINHFYMELDGKKAKDLYAYYKDTGKIYKA
jgi:hypothetical protein